LRIRSFAIIVALDRALAGEGLQIAAFCEAHRLSRRSVHRYLAFLRSMGMETTVDATSQNQPPILHYVDSEGLFTPLAEALVTNDLPGGR
jgi:hypothetical protein